MICTTVYDAQSTLINLPAKYLIPVPTTTTVIQTRGPMISRSFIIGFIQLILYAAIFKDTQ